MSGSSKHIFLRRGLLARRGLSWIVTASLALASGRASSLPAQQRDEPPGARQRSHERPLPADPPTIQPAATLVPGRGAASPSLEARPSLADPAMDPILQEILHLRRLLGSPWTGRDDARAFAEVFGELDLAPPSKAAEPFDSAAPLSHSDAPAHLSPFRPSASPADSAAADALLMAAHTLDEQAYELEQQGDSQDADRCRRLARMAWKLARQARSIRTP